MTWGDVTRGYRCGSGRRGDPFGNQVCLDRQSQPPARCPRTLLPTAERQRTRSQAETPGAQPTAQPGSPSRELPARGTQCLPHSGQSQAGPHLDGGHKGEVADEDDAQLRGHVLHDGPALTAQACGDSRAVGRRAARRYVSSRAETGRGPASGGSRSPDAALRPRCCHPCTAAAGGLPRVHCQQREGQGQEHKSSAAPRTLLASTLAGPLGRVSARLPRGRAALGGATPKPPRHHSWHRAWLLLNLRFAG